MSEITESEIKAMTKEENYIRGYKDGRADMLKKVTTALTSMLDIMSKFEDDNS